MIFSNKKTHVVVQRVKGGGFIFVTAQDFNIVRTDVVRARTISITVHHGAKEIAATAQRCKGVISKS